MAMHNPPHPGGIVRRQCLEPLGLTITEAAEALPRNPNEALLLQSLFVRLAVLAA